MNGIKKENVIDVLFVEPGKHPCMIKLENTLEAMQKTVGGYIEMIDLDHGDVIVVNEEGKLIGLEGNRRLGNDILTGSFFIAGTSGEDLASLSKESQKLYSERFWEPEVYTREEVEDTVVCRFFGFDFK